jgi:hypothetical protein
MRASVDLQAHHPGAQDALAEIRGWLENRPFTEEIESREMERLLVPLGELSREQVLECSSEFEAAAQLGWTLDFLPPPPEDRPCQAQDVIQAFGLKNPRLLKILLGNLRLLPLESIARQSRRVDLTYQRLARLWFLDDVGSDPSQERWVQQALEVGLPLIDGDLWIQGTSVKQAPTSLVTRALQSLEPRRRALAWILGDSLLYSRENGLGAAQYLVQSPRRQSP